MTICFFCSTPAEMSLRQADRPPVPHCLRCFIYGWKSTYRNKWQTFQIEPIPEQSSPIAEPVLLPERPALSAQNLLEAEKTADVTAGRYGDLIAIFIDNKCVLTLLVTPIPKVVEGIDNSITIFTGEVPVARVQADTARDARLICGLLSHLIYQNQFDPC